QSPIAWKRRADWKPGIATRSCMCSRSYQRLKSSSNAGSTSVQMQSWARGWVMAGKPVGSGSTAPIIGPEPDRPDGDAGELGHDLVLAESAGWTVPRVQEARDAGCGPR